MYFWHLLNMIDDEEQAEGAEEQGAEAGNIRVEPSFAKDQTATQLLFGAKNLPFIMGLIAAFIYGLFTLGKEYYARDADDGILESVSKKYEKRKEKNEAKK